MLWAAVATPSLANITTSVSGSLSWTKSSRTEQGETTRDNESFKWRTKVSSKLSKVKLTDRMTLVGDMLLQLDMSASEDNLSGSARDTDVDNFNFGFTVDAQSLFRLKTTFKRQEKVDFIKGASAPTDTSSRNFVLELNAAESKWPRAGWTLNNSENYRDEDSIGYIQNSTTVNEFRLSHNTSIGNSRVLVRNRSSHNMKSGSRSESDVLDFAGQYNFKFGPSLNWTNNFNYSEVTSPSGGGRQVIANQKLRSKISAKLPMSMDATAQMEIGDSDSTSPSGTSSSTTRILKGAVNYRPPGYMRNQVSLQYSGVESSSSGRERGTEEMKLFWQFQPGKKFKGKVEYNNKEQIDSLAGDLLSDQETFTLQGDYNPGTGDTYNMKVTRSQTRKPQVDSLNERLTFTAGANLNPINKLRLSLKETLTLSSSQEGDDEESSSDDNRLNVSMVYSPNGAMNVSWSLSARHRTAINSDLVTTLSNQLKASFRLSPKLQLNVSMSVNDLDNEDDPRRDSRETVYSSSLSIKL